MTGLVRKALLLSAAGLVVAGAALAAVPHPGNSTKPTGINVVGYSNPPDPNGVFSYIIRDALNAAIPFAEVVLDFSACTDIALCTVNTTTVPPGGSFVCAPKRWTGTADVNGSITFTIVGTSNNGGPARSAAAAACVSVFVNGESGFPSLIASAYDHSGGAGVGPEDLSLFAADFVAQLGAIYRPRSDYDKNGSVGGGDLSLFGKVFTDQLGGGGSSSSCGLVAPNNCP